MPRKEIIRPSCHPLQGWTNDSWFEVSSDAGLRSGLAIEKPKATKTKANTGPASSQLGTNLVINDLVERTAFVKQRAELDYIRILVFSRVSDPSGVRVGGLWTFAPNWFSVPSKQRTTVFGWEGVTLEL